MADLPRKAVTRTARLAGLPLGYAGRTAVGMGKRLGGAPAEAVLTEVQQRTAEQLFRTLGDLKGGAMKFGQALSIFEGALPEEIAAPYREQLTKLQDSAPPMPKAVVHQQLVRELGAGWKRSIVEFDEEPAAAASIGQVHRGRWKDGTEVAIKLQYPGAEQALLADLRQLTRLARAFGGLFPGIDIRALAEELRDRVAEELDYALEAEAQQRLPRRPPTTTRTSSSPARWRTASASSSASGCPARSSLAKVIADGTQEERDHCGRALRPLHVRGPGPHRHAPRRPAPGQLPGRPGPGRRPGPARRARLRRRGAAARGQAAHARSGG